MIDLELQSPALPVALLLRQLASLVEDLTAWQYTAKPVGPIESSVGAHVRHCLDHVAALVGALDTGDLDYDRRQRGTDVEMNRFTALRLMRELEARLASITPDDLGRPLHATLLVAAGQEPIRATSSVGRELAFVVSHTIHHNALVGAMVKLLGGEVPERFGYAPSTIAHLEQARRERCARSA